jgi:DNA-binding response OmpR family regulator
VAALLVVEDDEKIGSLLTSALQANGHQVRWQRTGTHALADAAAHATDLVLLDLGLPDMDGLQLCRELKRRQPQCVMVILTARREEMDVIGGLESGADDYLVKPFRLTELLARVRAHLRRATFTGSNETRPFTSGALRLDFGARRCRVADREVDLRPKEFDLLARLAIDLGTSVSRETLMADVWDQNWFGSTKTLDVHVAALRRRLALAAATAGTAAEVPTITTMRGHGYRLDPAKVR